MRIVLTPNGSNNSAPATIVEGSGTEVTVGGVFGQGGVVVQGGLGL